MNCTNCVAASATISRNADSICACTFAVLALGRYRSRSALAAVAAGSSTVVDMGHSLPDVIEFAQLPGAGLGLPAPDGPLVGITDLARNATRELPFCTHGIA